ncbi:MAG TPA: YciI family protein [Mucilaginibacter sp.]|nr:YciI family protein [Mucilaginibacter sp.]
MKQYLITGYDFTDPEALNRRMKARPDHLAKGAEMRKSGNYLFGGAILSDESVMIGSVMVLQFETEEELDTWKLEEPYIIQGVWESVDIKPFKAAVVN